MNFKRIITIATFIICVFLVFNVKTFSIENTDNSYEEQLTKFYQDSGAMDLMDKLPDESKDILKKSGIDDVNTDYITNLNPSDILAVLWQEVVSQVKTPVKILCSLIGVIMVTAIITSLQKANISSSTGQIFSVVSVLCISSILVAPVLSLIQDISDMLGRVSDYMLSFIPVFAGIITVSGKPVTAFTYNSMLVIVVESFMKIATTVLVPLAGIYLSIMLIASCSDQINVSGLIKGIRTTILWILGFIMTFFIGLLTIKSFVAKGADTVSLRASKYIISSSIPLVGGCIAEAFSIIQSSMGVIKASVGVFGIVSIIAIFLPSLIRLMLMSITISISKSVSDVMEVGKLSTLFEATNFCISLMSGITLCFNMMLIICTSLMLILGGGE